MSGYTELFRYVRDSKKLEKEAAAKVIELLYEIARELECPEGTAELVDLGAGRKVEGAVIVPNQKVAVAAIKIDVDGQRLVVQVSVRSTAQQWEACLLNSKFYNIELGEESRVEFFKEVRNSLRKQVAESLLTPHEP